MKIKKILTLTTVFVASFGIFLTVGSPKTEILNKIESSLSGKKLSITCTNSANYGFYASLKNIELKTPLAEPFTSKDGYLFVSYFYNLYVLSSPVTTETAKQLTGVEPTSIKISNSIFSPSKLYITISGEFGEIKGVINTKENAVRATLKLSQEFEAKEENQAKKNALLTRFKSSEEGYIYESGI